MHPLPHPPDPRYDSAGTGRSDSSVAGRGRSIAAGVSSTSSIRFQLAIPRCSMFVTQPNAIIGHDSIVR